MCPEFGAAMRIHAIVVPPCNVASLRTEASGRGFETELETKGIDHLNDGGEARVAVD